MIKNQLTHCAKSARIAVLDDASVVRTYVRDLDPTAPIADARDKGVFVGTTWSPPV